MTSLIPTNAHLTFYLFLAPYAHILELVVFSSALGAFKFFVLRFHVYFEGGWGGGGGYYCVKTVILCVHFSLAFTRCAHPGFLSQLCFFTANQLRREVRNIG